MTYTIPFSQLNKTHIPAAGVNGATLSIPDGAMIEVDGSNGIVRLVEPAQPPRRDVAAGASLQEMTEIYK